MAAGVDGVVHVVNDLEARHEQKPYAIKEAIEDELWWSSFVDSEDITVTVEGGVATIEGTVESWTEYSAVREYALEGGATWVVNDLSVTGSEDGS